MTLRKPIADFLIRERIFVVMLVFILCVQGISLYYQGEPEDALLSQMDVLEPNNIESALRAHPWLLVFYMALIFLALLGLFGGLIFLGFVIWRYRKTRYLFDVLHVSGECAWGISDVIKLIIGYVFFAYVINIGEYCIFQFLGVSVLLENDLMDAVNALFLDLGLVLFIVMILRKTSGGLGRHMGMGATKIPKSIQYGLGTYLAFIPVLVSAMMVSYGLVYVLDIEIKPHPLVPMLMEESSVIVMVFFGILACVIGPVCEELFFRAFAYPALRKSFGKIWAMGIVSLGFAFIHGSIYAIIPIFALGLCLVYVYERTGSIFVPITVHICHNTAMMIFTGFYKLLYAFAGADAA